MNWNQNEQQSVATGSAEVDQGLRSYMLGIYNYMTSALILTGLVAYFTAQSEALMGLLYGTPLKWVVMFAPLAFVFFLGFRIHKMSKGAAQFAFWSFSVLMGASMAYIFIVYTSADIARAFFITAATFGSMSLYGYTTKKDLSGWGSFLFMGVIGVIIASVVNIFIFKSTMFDMALSVISILIFTGLTAYDTQKLKNMYYSVAGNADAMARMTIIGALSLYIDFIVIFQNVLNLLGRD